VLAGDGGVVDHDVEPAEPVHRLADQGVDLIPARRVGVDPGNVAAGGADEVLGVLAALARIGPDVRDDDRRAFGGEANRDRAPDSGGGARYDRDAAFEASLRHERPQHTVWRPAIGRPRPGRADRPARRLYRAAAGRMISAVVRAPLRVSACVARAGLRR
jgi:hypothetical protein